MPDMINTEPGVDGCCIECGEVLVSDRLGDKSSAYNMGFNMAKEKHDREIAAKDAEIKRLNETLKVTADDAYAHLIQGEAYRNQMTKMSQLADKERLRAEKAEEDTKRIDFLADTQLDVEHNVDEWSIVPTSGLGRMGFAKTLREAIDDAEEKNK